METLIFFNHAENIYLMVAAAGTVSSTLITGSTAIPPNESRFTTIGHPDTIGKSTSLTLYVGLRLARVRSTGICKSVQ
jgi:hypothetical protein